MITDAELVDAKAAAGVLHLHPETVRKYTRAGKLGCIKIGRRTWYTDALLKAYLAENTVPAAASAPAAPAAPKRNPRRTYAT